MSATRKEIRNALKILSRFDVDEIDRVLMSAFARIEELEEGLKTIKKGARVDKDLGVIFVHPADWAVHRDLPTYIDWVLKDVG